MNVPLRAAIAGMVLLLAGGCASRTVTPPRDVQRPEVPSPPEISRPPTVSPPRAASAPPAPPPSSGPPVRPGQQTEADTNYREGVAMLEEGKAERALELFAAAWRDLPGHPGVEEKFPVALERLKKSGDEALRQGQRGDAGRKYAAVVRFLQHPASRATSQPFTRAELKQRIDGISKSLMEEGVKEYQQGKIEAAIATWRQVLAYDPSNEEAAKSVRTATTQLENLKKLTPPPQPPPK